MFSRNRPPSSSFAPLNVDQSALVTAVVSVLRNLGQEHACDRGL